MTTEGQRTEAEGSVRDLWKGLGRIREAQGLSVGQLHVKIGKKIPIKTLGDRLRSGRITSWEDVRLVAVVGLGQDECEWQEKFNRAQKRRKPNCEPQPKAPPPQVAHRARVSWWLRRRLKVLAWLAGVVVLGLVAAFIWPGWLRSSQPDPECSRVTDGTVRVFDVPGDQKRSFVKYPGERIQSFVPLQEVTGSDGRRFRRVLTPSRHDGYGWIPSDTRNLRNGC